MIKHPDKNSLREDLLWLVVPEGWSPSWWESHCNSREKHGKRARKLAGHMFTHTQEEERKKEQEVG